MGQASQSSTCLHKDHSRSSDDARQFLGKRYVSGGLICRCLRMRRGFETIAQALEVPYPSKLLSRKNRVLVASLCFPTGKIRDSLTITEGTTMAKSRLVPVHPGSYLKELLDELGLSQYRLAHDIGVPTMRISHVVRGTRPLTAELALRLERYFGQSARYWLQLQSRYDLDMAEDEIGRRVAREVRRCKAVA